MIAAIRIEATRTRLFLVVVVFSVAYSAASLLERLLWDYVLTDIQPDGEPTESWPQWLLTSLAPIVLRDRISYSYVVLPQPVMDVLNGNAAQRQVEAPPHSSN